MGVQRQESWSVANGRRKEVRTGHNSWGPGPKEKAGPCSKVIKNF